MRYMTTVNIKLKTFMGVVELRPGDTFKPKYPEAVKSLVAEGKLLPVKNALGNTSEARDQAKPYLDKNNSLRIPFDSDPQYHWWAGGQSIADTLTELSVPTEVWEKYTNEPYPKKVH